MENEKATRLIQDKIYQVEKIRLRVPVGVPQLVVQEPEVIIIPFDLVRAQNFLLRVLQQELLYQGAKVVGRVVGAVADCGRDGGGGVGGGGTRGGRGGTRAGRPSVLAVVVIADDYLLPGLLAVLLVANLLRQRRVVEQFLLREINGLAHCGKEREEKSSDIRKK